jgi:hypothetical protein
MQNVLQYNGKFYVCGTGRQTLVRSKTSNDNYYLLTMAAIAQETREMTWHVSAEEIAARQAAWVKPQPNYRYGALAKFAKLTTGAEKGAVTDLNLDV